MTKILDHQGPMPHQKRLKIHNVKNAACSIIYPSANPNFLISVNIEQGGEICHKSA